LLLLGYYNKPDLVASRDIRSVILQHSSWPYIPQHPISGQ